MAAIEAGDALGLEVIPRSELEEVRGENLRKAMSIYYPLRAIYTAYWSWDMVGWEIGRMIAVRDGLPDPGPKPNARGMQRMVYYITTNN
jgi:hypothetical protein